MPIFFVGYALLVWYLCARWRRSVRAFGIALVGFAGLMSINFLHLKLNDWTSGQIYLPVLQSIMLPYTLLVTGFAFYIACLPRRYRQGCIACGYSLEGIGGDAVRCPECGKAQWIEQKAVYRPSGYDRSAGLRGSDGPAGKSDQPAPQVIRRPGQQDGKRQAGDEAPAEQGEPVRLDGAHERSRAG